MQFEIDKKDMDGVRFVAYTVLGYDEIIQCLDLREDDNADWVKENEPSRLNYRENGTWYMWMQDGFRVLVLNTGCGCAHDCCGHPCSMSYTLYPEPDGITKIVYDIGYNY